MAYASCRAEMTNPKKSIRYNYDTMGRLYSDIFEKVSRIGSGAIYSGVSGVRTPLNFGGTKFSEFGLRFGGIFPNFKSARPYDGPRCI